MDEELIDTEFEGYFHNEGGNGDNSESSPPSEPQNDSDAVDTGDNTEQADEQERSEQVEQDDRKPTVDDVPAEFWTLIEEKTGGAYNKDTVDELETFEQILSDSQWSDLQEQL